ncbi:unnamed protein product [Plutella xylostella]|uniref:(diamondback moth) hypothetical protein n=1 Tax=Plutella xylostella TaxID=51655 RepID=A0A8S4FL00_PLUXY|nr:unnamed protein product [Plutella xylostella]
MGGLWEAGVKSIKHHLKRILTTNLTFEEMTTVLCEIEACLNSRPLCPIDEADTDNMDILTPGHFLIGEAPRAIPTPNLNNTKISTLSRWQHTQKLVQDFWKRWVQEYLTRLQQRPKWMNKQDEFKTGQIVLIKNDNLPPGKWALGRITDKHPGPDGYTRVYSVKSGDSILFVEPADTYSKLDNWPPESERVLTHRLCSEAPLPQATLLRLVFIGLHKVCMTRWTTDPRERTGCAARRRCRRPRCCGSCS